MNYFNVIEKNCSLPRHCEEGRRPDEAIHSYAFPAKAGILKVSVCTGKALRWFGRAIEWIASPGSSPGSQ